MNYNINMGLWGKVFAVPSIVADEYLKLATGKAVKVILYFLSNNSKDFLPETVAEAIGVTVEDVEDAVSYWESVGIFQTVNNFSENAASVEEITIQPKPQILQKQHSTGSLTPREIAERVEKSEEIKFLFSSSEASLCHLLTHTEQRSLIWIHDYLGLTADVILMLFEYCKVINKMNMRYIERVAITWSENDIITHEAAETEIATLKERHKLSAKVINAFGITRKLSSKEEEFIQQWTQNGYDIDIISYAYDKTVDAINKLSFPYINKILTGWYAKGLKTRELIDAENEKATKYVGKKEQNSIHSYDLDKFDIFALEFSKEDKK